MWKLLEDEVWELLNDESPLGGCLVGVLLFLATGLAIAAGFLVVNFIVDIVAYLCGGR